MYVQIVTGTVLDAALLGQQQRRWLEEVRPGAAGLEGVTTGTTLNGRSVTLLRYATAAAARADSERPEQDSWWQETARAYDDDLRVRSCEEVDLYIDAMDSATFVALVQGRAKSKPEMQARNAEFAASFRAFGPGSLGMLVGWDEDGGFSNAMFFRTEADARAIEAATDLEQLDQFLRLMDGDPTYFELPTPAHA